MGRRKGTTPKMDMLIENKSWIFRDFRRGISCSELARRMDVSRTTMYRFLHEPEACKKVLTADET